MTHDEIMAYALIAHYDNAIRAIGRKPGSEFIAPISAINPKFLDLLASSHLMYTALTLQYQGLEAIIEIAELKGASDIIEHLTALQSAVMLAQSAAQQGSNAVAEALRGDQLMKRNKQP